MKKLIFFLLPFVVVFLCVFIIIKLVILPENGKGALQVTSQPMSKVFIDGKYIGNTPLCRCETTTMISQGTYTLKLEPLNTSFAIFQEKITITKGVLTVADRKFGKGALSEGSIISLSPLSDKSSSELLVLSFPDKAETYIDADNAGITPLYVKNQTDSDHTLRLRREGYKDKNVRIRTPKGYKLTALIYLGLKENTMSDFGDTSVQPTPVLSPTTPLQKSVTILQTPNGFLRVRQTPALSGEEITKIQTGETFKLIEEQPGWFKIQLKDETDGWISSDYANKNN